MLEVKHLNKPHTVELRNCFKGGEKNIFFIYLYRYILGAISSSKIAV